MQYSTFLFDADDTLLDFQKAERTALRQVLLAFEITPTDALMDRYSVINASLWHAFERGEVTKEEIKNERYRRLFAEFGVGQGIDTRKVNDRYLEFLSQGGFLVDGANALCTALKERGCQLYIITNGVPHTQRMRLAHSGLAPLFSDIFVSEAVGAQKPFKAFFDYVLSHIGERDKRRILVVGDSLGSDIQGAANAGLDCVWYNPKGQRNDRGLPVKREVQTLAALAAWLGV
ncbi:MAG: YjjG family noncanonical pyrimidine nucleotidase [Clostridia bacterium]|nr:YjjG family noncanonical pyrimidine nucleotidase [Clostridia bacterium]